MKQLLIAEMKRALEIMESKPALERYKKVEQKSINPITREEKVYSWNELDRDLVELAQLFKLMRKHSIVVEKQIKEEN